MNGLIRKVSMATARATTRRGFLSGMARGLVGAGLGASFLFGGQEFAYAGSCTTKDPGDCGGDCTRGDSYGCYGATYCPFEGCTGTGDCSTINGYSRHYSWTCCCNSSVSQCTTCYAPGGGECECQAFMGSC